MANWDLGQITGPLFQPAYTPVPLNTSIEERWETPTGIFILREEPKRKSISGHIRFFLGHQEPRFWDDPAGLITYEIIFDRGIPRQVTITDTKVSEPLRRSGVGTQLVNKMEERARYYRAPLIRGYYLSGSDKFWTALGYSITGLHVIEKHI